MSAAEKHLREKDAVERQSLPRQKREPMVAATRLQVPLNWLRLLLRHKIGLDRFYITKAHTSGPTLSVTCDASPWGGGAVLMIDGAPVPYIATEWTAAEANMLQVTIGDCGGQTLWESLIMTIALKAWIAKVVSQRNSIIMSSPAGV